MRTVSVPRGAEGAAEAGGDELGDGTSSGLIQREHATAADRHVGAVRDVLAQKGDAVPKSATRQVAPEAQPDNIGLDVQC